jgi:MFS family permease
VSPASKHRARRRTLVGLFLSALLSSPGQTFVFALYIEHVMRALDLTRAQVSSSYAIATLSAAALLVGLGHVADRLRSRALLLTVMSAIAAGMALMSVATTAWHLLLALMLLRLAGQGAVGVSLLTVVVRRFDDNARGRPLSVATLGYPAGEALFPFLVAFLIAAVGWRASLGLLVGLYVVGALPSLGWLLQWPRRERVPLLHAAPAPGTTVPLSTILRRPPFWAALMAFSVLPIAITALFFHQVALFRVAGISEALVPLAFATYAGANATATAVMGHVVDRCSPRATAVMGIACFFGAVGLLLLAPASWLTVVAYAALLGTGAATATLAGSLVWPALFGDVGIGRVRAVAGGLRNCFTAGGPLLVTFGAAQPVLGATLPLLLMGTVGLAAACALPTSRSREPAPAVTPRRLSFGNCWRAGWHACRGRLGARHPGPRG